MRICSLVVLFTACLPCNIWSQSKDPATHYLLEEFGTIQFQLNLVKQKQLEMDDALQRIELVKRQIFRIKEIYELRLAGKKQLADRKLVVIKATVEVISDPQYTWEIAPLFILDLEGKPFPSEPTDLQVKMLRAHQKGKFESMIDLVLVSLEEQKAALQKEQVAFLRHWLNQIRTKK